MISEVKSYPILLGARGRKALDINAVADTIVRVSQISQDFEEIQEIEINPLMVQENGCIAVDALVVISGRPSSLTKKLERWITWNLSAIYRHLL